jgi:hypothetical protein
MNADRPPVSAPTAVSSAPPPAPKRRNWLLLGCGGLIALLLVILITVIITIWWLGRPIKPVVLSTAEKQAVEEKLNRLGGTPADKSRAASASEDKVKPEPDRIYVPGAKELRLTEREINGLLNENTDLGKSVRLEFGRDAINAYVATPIPDDVPVMGGKMFKARGRFRLSVGNGGEPYAILEDVTVFGLSLPKAWLGGLKGENLLGDAVGKHNGAPAFKGIKSLHVEPGALVIEVTE